MEICFSASSSKGTSRTEAERLGLLACLATSKFQHILGGTSLAPPTAVLKNIERLQITCSQKGLAWKAVAQPHLLKALLPQRHRDWGSLLVFPALMSNVYKGVRVGGPRQPCSENENVCRYLAAVRV